LGKQGVKNLIVVPVSFVSEHVETLEEIDMEYRELAEENGIHNWYIYIYINENKYLFFESLALFLLLFINPINNTNIL
jgi:ferrochelatase